VVVFDNKSNTDKDYTAVDNSDDESSSAFLVRILQYLETPQYLRKALFPMHNSLRFVVGLIFLQQYFLKFIIFFVDFCLVYA
jgi:predicted SPOUT superfamily RNA methylase MTH1